MVHAGFTTLKRQSDLHLLTAGANIAEAVNTTPCGTTAATPRTYSSSGVAGVSPTNSRRARSFSATRTHRWPRGAAASSTRYCASAAVMPSPSVATDAPSPGAA